MLWYMIRDNIVICFDMLWYVMTYESYAIWYHMIFYDILCYDTIWYRLWCYLIWYDAW